MGLFNFNQEELLTFFAVLVRYSVLIAVLPFVGDRFVPGPVKVLLAFAITIALFPALVRSGTIHPGDAMVWGRTAGGIIMTIGMEAIFALALGFTARMAFEAISFGGNLAGTFMGFASAATYDPSQESQSQIVAQIQMAIAMLVFLAIDGHHLMLRASLDSYRFLGIGGAGVTAAGPFNAAFSRRLVDFTAQIITFAIELSAPVAISLFAVNVAFGVMAKTMPQINVLVLSFAASALVGLFVMLISVPEFQGAASNILGRMGDWMESLMVAMATGK